MRFTRLSVILVSLSILAACQQADTNAPTSTTAATPMAAPVAAKTAAVTGVAVCDDYLSKYEACLRDKLPEATRAQFQSSLDAMRTSWMQLAANPQTAAALENACVQAKSSAAVAMQAYGCSFE